MKSSHLALTFSLFALGCPAPAQQVERLGPDVALLFGSGGNVLIVNGPNGVVLIDDQRPNDREETQAAIAQVSTGPVRYVIDTHWHLDHSGGNGWNARAGAVIVSHFNVRARRSAEQYMSAYDARIPPAPEFALPAITYENAMDLRHGAETIQLRHVANAHTDGDTIVRLSNANVIHMGDVFFNGYFPFIDRDSRGSVQGIIAALDRVLEVADERTRIVPSHGPIATRAELQAYRGMLHAISEQVRGAIAADQTRAQVLASDILAPYRAGREGDADGFLGAVYDCIAAEIAPRSGMVG